MKAMSLLAFLPDEAILLMLVFGGIAIMFQAKGIATALFTMAGLVIFLPIILEPFLEMLPEWALSLIMIVFVLSIPATILRMVMGKGIYENFMGALVANIVTVLFMLPFRCMGRIFRGFRR